MGEREIQKQRETIEMEEVSFISINKKQNLLL